MELNGIEVFAMQNGRNWLKLVEGGCRNVACEKAPQIQQTLSRREADVPAMDVMGFGGRDPSSAFCTEKDTVDEVPAVSIFFELKQLYTPIIALIFPRSSCVEMLYSTCGKYQQCSGTWQTS
jgi:hypothetical protein